MSATIFKGTGTVLLGNPPAAVNVAHGLSAAPTMFFAIPRLLSPLAAALNTMVVTADGTNVILTAAGNWAANVIFDVFAWVTAQVADEAAALLNTAHRAASGVSHANVVDNLLLLTRNNANPRPQALINVPAGFSGNRAAALLLANIAASATFVYTLAALKVAFPTIEFDNEPVSLLVDNPALSLAWTAGVFANGLTITNGSTTTIEAGWLHAMNVHSLLR